MVRELPCFLCYRGGFLKSLCAGLVFVISLGFVCHPASLIAEQPDRRTVDAFITSSLVGAPAVTVDLGGLNTANQLSLDIVLHNLTDHAVEYDSIAKGCNCQDIKPTKGKIAPSETMKLSLDVNMAIRPTSVESGGSLMFQSGQQTSMSMRFAYRLVQYAGFPQGVAIVEWDGEDHFSFELPVIMGSSLQDRDLDFSLEGIDGEARFQLRKLKDSGDSQRLLVVSVNVPSETTFSRQYGEVVLINLAGGEPSKCQVVVERMDPLKVFPTTIRLVRSDNNEQYEGFFFCKTIGFRKQKSIDPSSPDEPSPEPLTEKSDSGSSTDESKIEPPLLDSIRIELPNLKAECTRLTDASGLYRYRLTISADDVTELLHSNGLTNQQSISVKGKLVASVAGESVDLSIPLYFGDLQ